MKADERLEILEEERLIIRHSGEIPEVALHSSLHYLCEDTDGPGLELLPSERQALEEAVVRRYKEIILRDLDAGNRKLSLFRGIRRAHHNWYRFVRFCDSIDHASEEFRSVAAEALLGYLHIAAAEQSCGDELRAVNCTPDALLTFAMALGVDESQLPRNWRHLCEREQKA
ncbi:MAG: hypothetical protein GXY53_01225 [Desulfobulbus sp.]|nr:hypothetical protein [Desulfobulbus sp.]